MTEPDRRGRGFISSPLRLFAVLLGSVFVAEIVVMVLLSSLLPDMGALAAVVADATILALVIAPLLWWYVVRPLRRARRSETARALTAMEAAANGIVITDREGAILWVNPAFLRVTGFSLDEVVGQTQRILESGQHDEAFYRDLWGTIQAGKVWRGRMVNRRKDGSFYHEEQTITPVRDERGAIESFIAIKEDVSARTKAEEALRESEAQLRQAQKMEAVGRLAGGVAHDFNNLLTVIMGHSALMSGRMPDDDPNRAGLDAIHGAAEKAASLTRQLLAFSRRQVLEPRVLALNDLLAGIVPMLKRLIGEDIELICRPGPDLGRVRTDPGQLEQVVMNLVINARDAMPDGGKLTIETMNVDLDETYASDHVGAAAGEYVLLAVTDTGCGMSGEIRARIFEPFFTTKAADKGTGLGLSTVYGIVKQSGGNVWCYSEPGHGSTFKVYLPHVRDAVVEARASAAPDVRRRGDETVLIVEDDEPLRSLAREILTTQGYTVIEASRPADALDASARHAGVIHLLLTDVVLPGMNGSDLARQLTARRPEMKVLYMSGYTADAIAHHGVLDVGVAFIQKPFTATALANRAREVLDAS